ncbi:MAG: Cytidylyltransferase family protein [bacterium ADurb.Bin478]|nr:MAG: Cytidylyltransferase family protein [bacterium ADurb.Bin478]
MARGFPADLSRKVIHIAAGSFVIFWPLFDASHWSRFFCVAMPFIWVLLFLSKGLSSNTEDPAVKTMTRTGNPRELLRGPLMFAVMMVAIGLALFNRVSAVAALGMMTWGDGLAPYFGAKFGKAGYQTLGAKKTLVGSVTVFIAGVAGSVLMLMVTGLTGAGIPWSALLVSGVVAMVVEALSPRDVDNIAIPLSTLIVFYLMQGRL